MKVEAGCMVYAFLLCFMFIALYTGGIQAEATRIADAQERIAKAQEDIAKKKTVVNLPESPIFLVKDNNYLPLPRLEKTK